MAKTPKHFKEIICSIVGINHLAADVPSPHIKHMRKVQTAFRSSNIVGVGASYKTIEG